MIGIIAAVIGVLGYIALGLLLVRASARIKNQEAAINSLSKDYYDLLATWQRGRDTTRDLMAANGHMTEALSRIEKYATPGMANIGHRMVKVARMGRLRAQKKL